MNRQLALFAAAPLASLPGMAGAQSIEPGLWEITVTLQGTGTAQPQQHTTQRCYSEQDLNDLQNVAPSAGMGAQCRMLNSNQSGNRYSYTL